MIFLSLIYFLLLNSYNLALLLAILISDIDTSDIDISHIDISDIDADYVKIRVWETTLR